MSILLVTPPFTQLNTPYPATAYLKGFLNTKDIPATQMDLGIEVILRLFSRAGLADVFATAERNGALTQVQGEDAAPGVARTLALRGDYLDTIDGVIAFLQGRQPTLARQIAGENYLPQGERFAQLDELDQAFGSMGLQDKAKHLATLYLEDLADFIVATVDADFGFSRYAERIGRSANSFDELYGKLTAPPTYVDDLTLTVLEERMAALAAAGALPTLVCFSVPFPGNLYSAFRCAGWLRRRYPGLRTAMGGGFPNTELRSVTDPRVFDFFNFITLDDGELPLALLYGHLTAPASAPQQEPVLKRTFLRENGVVVYNDYALQRDYRMSEVGTPDYTGLPLDRYVSVIEVANPMHSLWSDGRWNKLTMAHGCYWGKCTFCDVSLDYIGSYEPVRATLLADRMEELVAQTGETGFHFVDEAAPPALMRDLALEILKRRLRVTWWTNIRFEKSFTPDLCRLLQASGCVAVSGGLEVASDRLLDLIKKGVTVAQVARVTAAFTDAGIMVHSYLMYGYPTQTVQETVDSLEMVRQLFAAGIVQSGFWHRFALTAHSPVGLDPAAFGIVPQPAPITFANNDVAFTDPTGVDHAAFAHGLRKSLYNYMHGLCLEFPLQEWFDFPIPPTTVGPYYIVEALDYAYDPLAKDTARMIWVGGQPQLRAAGPDTVTLVLYDRRDTDYLTLPTAVGEWVHATLLRCGDRTQPPPTVADVRRTYQPEDLGAPLDDLWETDAMGLVRAYGLLVV